MAATLKDIAEKLNISISTVSRVVNNKEYVNPETRELVMEALEKYNYAPNRIARSLKSKTTNSIGVIVPDISEVFFTRIIKGVDNVVSHNKYSIILSDSNEDSVKENKYLKLLTEKQVDGIILATISKESTIIKNLLKSNTPIVFIDNLPDVEEDYDSVIIDNWQAGFMVVEHFVKLQHKKIGIIVGKEHQTTGFERLRGYKDALKKYNIAIDERIIAHGDYKEESGYRCMKDLLEQKNAITAVFVGSSKMTYGAIKAIRESGLRIPQDIAIVGADTHDPTGLIVPKITTVVQPDEYIGKLAGDLLIKRIQEGAGKYKQKIVLQPQLSIKDSCGYKDKAKKSLN